MKRSLLEGPIYALMVGLGESYFIAAAVRLGASPLELGLVVGLPLAAACGRTAVRFIVWSSDRRSRRKDQTSQVLPLRSLTRRPSASSFGWRT